MSSAREELDRLDRATSRLMQAHHNALEVCQGALDDRVERPVDGALGHIPGASTPLDTSTPHLSASASGSGEGRLYRAALEDVRAILGSASEDLRVILGEGDEGGG